MYVDSSSPLYQRSLVNHTYSTITTEKNVTNSLNPRPFNTTASTHRDCIALQYQEYNPDNIVSNDVEDFVHTMETCLFLPVFFLIGCPANVINMIVFYKHGLKERINVCLFALSFADEMYMINNILWNGDQLYLHFTTKEKYGIVVTFLTNNHLGGLHGFIWVSQVLTAIIASERCFCILYPLRSQTVLQTSTMTVIIIIINIAILGLVSFELLRYQVVCAYDPITMKTIITAVPTDFYYQHQMLIDYLDVFVLGVGLPGLVIIVVIATTIVTTARLRQAALWRAETSSRGVVSERDIALTKMLIANSVFFIICVTPFVVFRIIFLILPEVNAGGRQHNFYMMIQWILIIISYFNASLNIVVYYTMGSRYRQTFWQLFGKTYIKPLKLSMQHTKQ